MYRLMFRRWRKKGFARTEAEFTQVNEYRKRNHSLFQQAEIFNRYLSNAYNDVSLPSYC
jgi:hypothetical protein